MSILEYNSNMVSSKILFRVIGIALAILGIFAALFSGWWMVRYNMEAAQDEPREIELFAVSTGQEAFREKWIGATSRAALDGEVAANDTKETLRAKRLEEEKAALAAKRVQRDLMAFINLQPVVDRWLATYRFTEAAVEIYDVDYGVVAASYRASATMSPRSIYKLFYVYDGYAQIDAGVDDAGAIYLGDMTLGYCLDIMVRQSNNACAEAMLEDDLRLQRVGQLITDLGLANTSPEGLSTSAHDVSLLLQYYYKHPEWSADSWWKFRSSALNQAFAFRKGLPAGFSKALVYNKTGYGSGYSGDGHYAYNDAAMVEFALADGTVRRYIMVVMTSDPSSYTILTRLGEMLEEAIIYV